MSATKSGSKTPQNYHQYVAGVEAQPQHIARLTAEFLDDDVADLPLQVSQLMVYSAVLMPGESGMHRVSTPIYDEAASDVSTPPLSLNYCLGGPTATMRLEASNKRPIAVSNSAKKRPPQPRSTIVLSGGTIQATPVSSGTTELPEQSASQFNSLWTGPQPLPSGFELRLSPNSHMFTGNLVVMEVLLPGQTE